MEEKVAIKKLLEFAERPSCDNNTDHAPNMTQEPSFQNNTMGSTFLSLSLINNSSEQLPHQIQGEPLSQMGMLRVKLEEAKKENESLKAMLVQVNEHHTVLQNRLLLAMQHHQSSMLPRNNHDLLKGNRQDDEEKAVLPTRQFLNIGEASSSDHGSKAEGFASAEKLEKSRNIACDVESEINSQITSQETKSIDEPQTSEVTRKARVSIRARSDFSLMGDGCQWRKYGQKTAKGNPCPRAYYRCSMGTACPVRKQVQRCFKDETVLITTYEGNHNHPLPPAARPIASLTSSALNMFLSPGSATTLQHGSTTVFNTRLFSSSVSSALASFSPSATCPTVTLDFTQPTNNNNYLQFQRPSSQSLFPFPLQGYNFPHQTHERLNLCSSKLPTMITTPLDKNHHLALVDVVSEAIAKDPSLQAALFAAVSSLKINNQNPTSKSDYDPGSKLPTIPLI